MPVSERYGGGRPCSRLCSMAVCKRPTAPGACRWMLSPPDIFARFERLRGNRVLMVSGSDEHGTPITVTTEQDGVNPQQIVDQYHAINTQALLELGCTWLPNIDERGIEYGGSLFNRTSDQRHKDKVQENFKALYDAGFFERRTMQQYFEVHENGGVVSFQTGTSKEHVRLVEQMVPEVINAMHVEQPMNRPN